MRSAAYPLALAALLTAGGAAEDTTDVVVTLSTKVPKIRQGDAVEAVMSFSSSTAGRYDIRKTSDNRTVRRSLYDRFIAEPVDSAVDPLADIPAQLPGEANGMRAMQPLSANPVTIGRDVNEWISFRRPGLYRIMAETTRVHRAGAAAAAVPLKSNWVEIEIVAPEPGWAAKRLEEAVSIIEKGSPPPRIGQIYDVAQEAAIVRAGRVLRFLETREAALALVRFFENGPMTVQQDLRAGLFASPHRAEVIAAMEEQVSSPGRGISYYFLATLVELHAAASIPPDPPYPVGDPEALPGWNDLHRKRLEQIGPIEQAYFAKLAAAIPGKRGSARTLSLETLITRGPEPVSAGLLNTLVNSFEDLPEGSQRALLTHDWYRIASPRIVPLLRRMARSGGEFVRGPALLRLIEIDPDAARDVAIERIRLGSVGQDVRPLLLLPDETLPELEDALTTALEQGKPVEALVARYATPAAFGRARMWHESTAEYLCGPILGYFFRVDPAYAAARLERIRAAGHGNCAVQLAPNEDLLMSPGLEAAAIRDLSHSDRMLRRSAQSLLQHGGSPDAQPFLWRAFESMRDEPAHPMDSAMEYGFTEALLKANAWVLGQDGVERLFQACRTPNCRDTVSRESKALKQPVHIGIDRGEPGAVMLGVFRLRTEKQLRGKVAQFSPGTRFTMQGPRPPGAYLESRANAIRKLLEAAGMQVER